MPCKQLAVEVLIVTDQQSLAFVGFVQESLSLSTLLADIRKLHGWKESSKIVFVGDVPYMDIPM